MDDLQCFAVLVSKILHNKWKFSVLVLHAFTSCNSVLTTLLTLSQLCDEPMTMLRVLWTLFDDFKTILKQLTVWRVRNDPYFEIYHKTTLKSSLSFHKVVKKSS